MQALLLLSFSGSVSRSGSSFKMNNFWTISHYLLRETWFMYPLTREMLF